MTNRPELDEMIPGEEDLREYLHEQPLPPSSPAVRDAVLAEARRRPWSRRAARPTLAVVGLGMAAALAAATVLILPETSILDPAPTPTPTATATPKARPLPPAVAEALLPQADEAISHNQARVQRAMGPGVQPDAPPPSRQLLGRAQRLRAELDFEL